MDFFVARLMSLSEHELRCLRSDQELQSHLQRTHLLMETKLQQYSNASISSSPPTNTMTTFMLAGANETTTPAGMFALDLRLSEQQQANFQLAEHSQHHRQQHQHHQQQQQQLHQQLHLQLQAHQQQLQHFYQQQQQHHQHQQQQQQQQMFQQHQQQHQQRDGCFNYKKMKFIEWSSISGSHDEGSPTPPASSASTASTSLARDDLAGSPPTSNTPLSSTATTTSTSTTTTSTASASASTAPSKATHLKSPAGGSATALTVVPTTPATMATTTTTTTTTGGKKYKGEFDEPSTLEVELRVKLLMVDDNYHSKNSPRGECACILGSEFRDKSASSMLMLVEQWRQMPTDQRVTFKWDMNDLPKDIPLSDIKRFENLRREASSGRADFGGASKRKPLGIRGTRQFLLILYCLWGHPGRDDPMQREGYCPHCFAKIKKPNEQSTLVRVVNHFNMKHRRGANPRC